MAPQLTLWKHLGSFSQSTVLDIVWQWVQATISSLNDCNSFGLHGWLVVVVGHWHGSIVFGNMDTAGGHVTVDWGIKGHLTIGHVGHVGHVGYMELPIVIPEPEIRKKNQQKS